VASVIAALRGSVAARTTIAVVLLVVNVGLDLAWLADAYPFSYAQPVNERLAVFLAVTYAVAALGVARRLVWGRWMGLGIGVAGVLSGGLNGAGAILFADGQLIHTWSAVASFFAGGLLVGSLAPASVRDAFLARSKGGALWGSRDRLIASVRWAIVADLIAAFMLLVYAWTQPVVPATVASAQALALLLLVAIGLAAARKVVGALLLALGGFGLLAQTAFTVAIACSACDERTRTIVTYYAVFWTPAALLSLAAGATLAKPVLALLRRR
jgi:hypothetical protein